MTSRSLEQIVAIWEVSKYQMFDQYEIGLSMMMKIKVQFVFRMVLIVFHSLLCFKTLVEMGEYVFTIAQGVCQPPSNGPKQGNF